MRQGHREVFALVAGVRIEREHVRDLLGRLEPHRALVPERHAVALELAARGGLAGPELDAAAGDQVERGDPLRNAGGVVVVRRHRDDAVAEPDPLRVARRGREHDLGRGRVRVLLEEVVLDLPHVVDADLVGELDLLDRVLEELLLAARRPGPRMLQLQEDAELHRSLRSGSRAAAKYTDGLS